MRKFASFFNSPVSKSLALVLALPLATLAANAQSLSYEGPTGIFITPLAYTAASPANGLGKAAVAYHNIAGGPRTGDWSSVSATVGFAKRFEFGYTSELHAGSNTLNVVGPLVSDFYGVPGNEVIVPGPWTSGFSVVHAKANVIAENSFGMKLIPAVSVGGIYRFNDSIGPNLNVIATGILRADTLEQKTNNFDIYVVASKTITQISKHVPVLLTAGLRGTNSSIWGLGGNAPGFEGKVFGSAAFVITGPGKSAIIPAVEVSEQPQHILIASLPRAALFDVPTSEVYAVRFVPSPKCKLNIDAGVLHAGGWIGNGATESALGSAGNTNLNMRARVAFGISYGF